MPNRMVSLRAISTATHFKHSSDRCQENEPVASRDLTCCFPRINPEAHSAAAHLELLKGAGQTWIIWRESVPRALFLILNFSSCGHSTNSVHRQKHIITEQRVRE